MKKTRYCSKCHLPVHKGDCHSIVDKEIDWVCNDCGIPYLLDSQRSKDRIHTYNQFTCDVCGEVKSVTDPRNFNYLVHPDYRKSRYDMRERRKLARKAKREMKF